MIRAIAKFLIRLLTNLNLINTFVLSYSQEGEDVLLRRFFEKQKKGFYVDIGAHHPTRFSSTFLFYKKGWIGINIEPMPKSKTIFDKKRPRDINLQMGISSNNEVLNYYIFKEKALNTFDKSLAYKRKINSKLLKVLPIKVEKLEKVLDKYLPNGQSIDFMNVDGQGLELEILKSNNWTKYRPRFLLVECLIFQGLPVNSVINSNIENYMKSINYEIFSKTFSTLIYVCKD